MMEPILVVLAAGMGSRYGGLKQMDPLGPGGEKLLDYSVYDARRAGFRRVVFIIKHEIEADFRRLVSARIEPHMQVEYAFQQLEMLPEGHQVPEGRVKPWGTGHAVLCAQHLLDAPFLVINADDYYGVDAYRVAYQTLATLRDDDKARYFMVGYQLQNTVTENGSVARGVCAVDQDGNLISVNERTHIITSCDGPLYTEDGRTYHLLPGDTPVSMNMFGFTPSLLEEMRSSFPRFLTDTVPANPMKAEYYVPGVVNDMLQRGAASVRVLTCTDRWYGVTYQADKPQVISALRRMHDEGLYPTPIWG
ncbi:MAG: NTP transferase domain-containing protein [Clostridia bacterium]|nr:NTP transferase domain-containing protein [Clostridia bacterium]